MIGVRNDEINENHQEWSDQPKYRTYSYAFPQVGPSGLISTAIIAYLANGTSVHYHSN